MPDICCSSPTAEPNYTICFPETQYIPGRLTPTVNPYYDFINKKSYWTYFIQIDEGAEGNISDLSHWDIQMCPDLTCRKDPSDFYVEYSTDGINYIPVPVENIEVFCNDPGDKSIPYPDSNGLPYVLKINQSQDKGSTVYYRITILNDSFFDLAPDPGLQALKHGEKPGPNQYEIFNGITCGTALPSPSITCKRVIGPILSVTKTCPTHPDRGFFIPGETATIDILFNNAGDVGVINQTILDQIFIPSEVVVIDINTTPAASTITPPLPPYIGPVTVDVVWNGIDLNANSSKDFKIALTIGAAPQDITNIENKNVGIGTLPSPPEQTCQIPVKSINRGINYKNISIL